MSKIAGTVDDPCVLWYALKACIRNSNICFGSHLNKAWFQNIKERESQLAEFDRQEQISFCETRKQSIDMTPIELDCLL